MNHMQKAEESQANVIDHTVNIIIEGNFPKLPKLRRKGVPFQIQEAHRASDSTTSETHTPYYI